VRLSIVIPAYREEDTITPILERVLAVDLTRLGVQVEVIVCDDCSDDQTAARAEEVAVRDSRVRVVRTPENRGKGAAIRCALETAAGDYVLIQDADLEYDPADYPALLEPALRGAPIVYGSRFVETSWPKGMKFPNWLINRLLAGMSNVLFGLRITDEATCLKLVRTDVLRSFALQCNRFEFCPEVTAKAGLYGHAIVERPIRYHARTASAGKKIRWTDGVAAIWTLLKWRLRGRKKL
jgi:dolichol-phosphate mannosyltransferase